MGETQEQSEDSEGYLTQLVLKDEKEGPAPQREQEMPTPRGTRGTERPQQVFAAEGGMGQVEGRGRWGCRMGQGGLPGRPRGARVTQAAK